MDTAQSIVHSVEQGRGSRIIRVALIAAAIFGVALVLLGFRFRGFYHAEAMDQAQLSRQIANGKGFTTKFIRPIALWQMEKNDGGKVNLGKNEMPDTFNQPLPALLNVLPLKLSGNAMAFARETFIPAEERWIAAFSMLFFLASVYLQFLLTRRLFDQRLAFLVAGLTVVCNLFWQFSLSGLPQMLMLLIFSGALYALARAIEENLAGALAIRWYALTGGLFGLVTLCHGLAVWPFLGLLLFAAIYFRPHGFSVAVMLAAFLVVVAPWLIRNYNVSGNIFGTASFWIYDGVKGSAAYIFRSAPPDLNEVTPMWWRPKLQAGILSQAGNLLALLGGGVVAPLFFVSLLHPFKRRETADLRWAVLLMWLFAVGGMALYGLKPGVPDSDHAVASNQLHVLFVPVMIAFGLAFLLTLANRLSFWAVPLLQTGFMIGIFAICGLPLFLALLPSSAKAVQFPPYLPAVAHLLNTWAEPGEIVVSDQPWAVAWYADRRSLWMPAKLADFATMSDYKTLGAPFAGLFLSPVTLHAGFMVDIGRGEYKEWAQPIFRSPSPSFPFKEMVPLVDGDFLFYSDSRRWERPPK
jgi:hypothetical protein